MPHPTAAILVEPHVTYEASVPSRFCGPPGSGNGGYTVGLLGKHLGSQVEVTLQRPIPLDATMQVISVPPVGARLVHGTTDIATARRAELDLDVPTAVSFACAEEARANYPGYEHHPFPDCFVCGTKRSPGDGLHLFTGPVGDGIMASSWTPAAEAASEDGVISHELTGAALDCPGAWALIDRYGIEGPIVLGRLTYRMEKAIHAGERYVVMGWPLGREGRKACCGTAVYDADGQLCAAAAAVWIRLR